MWRIKPITTHYERILRENKYHGEKRRHNFHKYETQQLDAIQSLNNLKPYGYSGVDDRSSVCYLLDGIKDTSLYSTKNTVLVSDLTLRRASTCSRTSSISARLLTSKA